MLLVKKGSNCIYCLQVYDNLRCDVVNLAVKCCRHLFLPIHNKLPLRLEQLEKQWRLQLLPRHSTAQHTFCSYYQHDSAQTLTHTPTAKSNYAIRRVIYFMYKNIQKQLHRHCNLILLTLCRGTCWYQRLQLATELLE